MGKRADESDAKLLAGKEKREMEETLKRGVNRDKWVNEQRDREIEEQSKNLPKDQVKSGTDARKITSRILCST